jgi:hypothetical protein
MEGHAYIGELAAGIFYLIVGARLLRLASRTGETPERLLAVMFVANGLSYVLYTIPVLFTLEPLWTPLNFAGRVTYLPAPVLMAAFTRQLFRREDPWAAWLVVGTAALLVAGVAGSVLGGDWEGFAISSRWFWLEWLGYTVPFGWAGAEAFGLYRQARRRLPLGLCEPLVCNRFLLWSLFAIMQVCSSLAVLPQYATYELQNLFSTTWDTLIGAVEILSVAAIWLVFFPPAAYRRWIAGGEALAGAVEEN